MATLRDVSEMAGWVRGLSDKIERGAAKGVIAITHEAERTAKLMTKQQFTGRRGKRKTGNLMNAIKSKFAPPETTTKGRPLLQGFVVVRGQKGEDGTKPYGRAHEFGAEIKPKHAKWLWLKNYEGDASAFKDMTPTDFINGLRANPNQFKLIYPNKKTNKQKIPIAWWIGELKAKVKANRTTKPRRKASIGATLKRSLRKSLGIGGKGSGKKRGARKTSKETGPRWVPLFFLRKHVTIPERPFVRPAIQASVGPNGRRFWAVLQRFIRQE